MLSKMFEEPSLSLSKSTRNHSDIRSELLRDLREYLFISWKLSNWLLLRKGILLLEMRRELLLKAVISKRILRILHHLSLSILLLIGILLCLVWVIWIHSLAHRWLKFIWLSYLTLHLLNHKWLPLYRLSYGWLTLHSVGCRRHHHLRIRKVLSLAKTVLTLDWWLTCWPFFINPRFDSLNEVNTVQGAWVSAMREIHHEINYIAFLHRVVELCS